MADKPTVSALYFALSTEDQGIIQQTPNCNRSSLLQLLKLADSLGLVDYSLHVYTRKVWENGTECAGFDTISEDEALLISSRDTHKKIVSETEDTLRELYDALLRRTANTKMSSDKHDKIWELSRELRALALKFGGLK